MYLQYLFLRDINFLPSSRTMAEIKPTAPPQARFENIFSALFIFLI